MKNPALAGFFKALQICRGTSVFTLLILQGGLHIFRFWLPDRVGHALHGKVTVPNKTRC